jgi:hypothetical protein
VLHRLLGNQPPVGQFAIDAGDLDMRGNAKNARSQLLLKPFITDNTTMSAATPRPMPSIEISDMNEMKWLRFGARVTQANQQFVGQCHADNTGRGKTLWYNFSITTPLPAARAPHPACP